MPYYSDNDVINDNAVQPFDVDEEIAALKERVTALEEVKERVTALEEAMENVLATEDSGGSDDTEPVA